jgi:hypothetical protein
MILGEMTWATLTPVWTNEALPLWQLTQTGAYIQASFDH